MKNVIDWFLKVQRDFPWRKEKTPYRVWVSEVMLQQTRATVVVPYFEKWMEKFPTLTCLAKAEIGEVIKAWEGLGYYSRARNIHLGAQEVVKKYGGELPSTLLELLSIKGIGPYTAGAILSFAFGKKAAAIDGNVLRVLSRLYAIESKKEIENRLLEALPEEGSAIAMEGLIELGALICTKTPKCTLCPLQKECKALLEERIEEFPPLKERSKTITLHRLVGCIESEGAILLKKGEKGKIMEDLYEFPYVEGDKKKKDLESMLGLPLTTLAPLGEKTHSFTKYKVYLHPYHYRTPKRIDLFGYEWVLLKDLEKLPYPSGHREIAKQILTTLR
jgi:A/G-specific adenine glycosylase